MEEEIGPIPLAPAATPVQPASDTVISESNEHITSVETMNKTITVSGTTDELPSQLEATPSSQPITKPVKKVPNFALHKRSPKPTISKSTEPIMRLSSEVAEFIEIMSTKSVEELAGDQYTELSKIAPPPSSQINSSAPDSQLPTGKVAARKTQAASLLTAEHHMAAIMYWKLSKHKLTEYENAASRKNSEKPQKSFRYDFVCQKFKEQYKDLDPPSYALLHDKIKLFKEKKPLTNYETRHKYVQEQSQQKVRKALEALPPNSVISTWQISKKVSLAISTVERCLEKENELVTKRVHYFKKANVPNPLTNITNQPIESSSQSTASQSQVQAPMGVSNCDLLSKFAQFSALEKHTYMKIFEATETKFPQQYRKRELIDIAGIIFKNKFNRQPPKVTSVFKMFKQVKTNEPLVKERKRGALKFSKC